MLLLFHKLLHCVLRLPLERSERFGNERCKADAYTHALALRFIGILIEFINNPIYYEKIGYDKETYPSMFIPNTYEVYWNIKPETLITRLMNERRRFWNEERSNKAKILSAGFTAC